MVGAYARIGLCADSGGPRLTISAPASCGRAGSRTTYGCRTTGTWTARRAGNTLTGTLPGPAEHPGPGTYDLTATVHIQSRPAGVDLQGTVRASLTLTTPRPNPTHTVTVNRTTLRRATTATLTYTVHRDSEDGDGSARFGLIGEEASGTRITLGPPAVGLRWPAPSMLASSWSV
ncbi:hypothetical protein ABZ618_00225 [Streptomyces roseolus]|uniref:hypothetical protein n=1 Tax=Streptomyces roseolus TaxID=67358 RepID=UPI003410F913